MKIRLRCLWVDFPYDSGACLFYLEFEDGRPVLGTATHGQLHLMRRHLVSLSGHQEGGLLEILEEFEEWHRAAHPDTEVPDVF